jgi:predicted transcriptional regulator of viral defense system
MSRPDYLKQIETRFTSVNDGNVFITSDFLDIADTQTVNKALSRLTEDKKIRRILRGVYDSPRYSKLLQEYTAPKMESVATAIARNFGWTIVPCGDTALNMLGLSTQVPTVWLYVSDGPYREYQIDTRMLKFKHTSNKDITGISYKSALVIQALKALGEANVTGADIIKLKKALSPNERTVLLSEAQYGTAWTYKIIKNICGEEDTQ